MKSFSGLTALFTFLSLSFLPAPARAQGVSLASHALWKEHEGRRFVMTPAPCLTPDALAKEVDRLAARRPGFVSVETIGKSFHDRPIRMMTVGRGPRTILLWSQMHGDEPSATPALLDLADFLAENAESPDVSRIVNAFTLRMIPMLNPDGSALYERRNAQGIDINRDALMLTTPEGVLLKSIRDSYQPFLGFNLHDQNRRVTVGTSGVVSSISLLAVAGDERGTLTPGRERAKRVAGRIVSALSSFIPGGIARYDEDWNPRAFGDNVTAWGTPVVLIESGGFPKDGGFPELTRLNFVALVSVLDGLARNDLKDVPMSVYDDLKRNVSDAYADAAIRGASILEPRSGRWFAADVAWDALASDQTLSGCAPTPRHASRVVEIGDSRVVSPALTVDGRDTLLVPLSRDRGLAPGPVSRETLQALWPAGSTADPTTPDARAFLGGLRLSEAPLVRGGPASFVVYVPPGRGSSTARYFAVVDGVGLPASLK